MITNNYDWIADMFAGPRETECIINYGTSTRGDILYSIDIFGHPLVIHDILGSGTSLPTSGACPLWVSLNLLQILLYASRWYESSQCENGIYIKLYMI